MQIPVPGVRVLDHTADWGIEVEADSLADLLDRAAAGMFVLLYGEDDVLPPPTHDTRAEERDIAVAAPDAAALLVAWLRELLHLHEAASVAYLGTTFLEVSETDLRARVRMLAPSRSPVREIKGVTYHGLVVQRESAGRWRGRVIFDV